MSKISVVTLVKGRKKALQNLIKGLTGGSKLPDELLIVFINELPYQINNTDFPIHSIHFTDTNNIPLAKARNEGVKHASFDKLIFLDVDCVPAKDLVKIYADIIDNAALISGAIRYLPEHACEQPDWLNKMEVLSNPDPIRANINEPGYELFWSLNFGCSKTVFNKIGGFNQQYEGYGAEDTDFSFRARATGIPLVTINATAYHQYHDSYYPPLNHFNDIIKNARLFYKIWNHWPMEGWLRLFVNTGLIHWGNDIQIIRQPTKHEINNAIKIN